METNNRIDAVLIAERFELPGKVIEAIPYGSGHINDTFRVKVQTEEEVHEFILQRVNTEIFTEPEKLMDNIEAVTSHLRKKIAEANGDPDREALTIVPAKDGTLFYKDENGFWRCYLFIGNTLCFDLVDDPDLFYQSGVSFGKFQKLLADFPVEVLHESIPMFHNTKNRYRIFKEAVEADKSKRAASCEEEIRFYLERKKTADFFTDLLEQGTIPMRVTHNDTKLNNILFDGDTKKAICILDLDTVMPGLAAYDFGDSIRFGASTAEEDEKDLSKVTCSMDLYRVFTKGFLEACGDKLTEEEVRLLPMGALVMTYECGMRFLTDYLQGDVYFKTARPEHNLDRARTQMKLVADMEAKWDEMTQFVEAYLKTK